MTTSINMMTEMMRRFFNGGVRGNTVVILVCMVVLLALGVDVMTRLGGSNDKEHTFNRLVAPEAPYLDRMNEQEHALLLEKLTSFAKSEQDSPGSVDTEQSSELVDRSALSIEQQTLQEGEVVKLYVGDYSYELMAIFHQQKTFAVFKKTNVSTAESEVISISLRDGIENYTLTQVETSHVVFENQDRKILIRLFQLS